MAGSVSLAVVMRIIVRSQRRRGRVRRNQLKHQGGSTSFEGISKKRDFSRVVRSGLGEIFYFEILYFNLLYRIKLNNETLHPLHFEQFCLGDKISASLTNTGITIRGWHVLVEPKHAASYQPIISVQYRVFLSVLAGGLGYKQVKLVSTDLM